MEKQQTTSPELQRAILLAKASHIRGLSELYRRAKRGGQTELADVYKEELKRRNG